MNPLGNRARAEELARLLEGAVAGSPGTAGYGALAARLRAAAPALQDTVALRSEFRDSLRQRLVAVATVQGPAAATLPSAVPAGAGALERAVTWSRTWTAQKRIAVASGAMAGVVAVTGVAVASSRSLPGQPFYGLKRASEGIELKLADGDTAKGTKHLEFAATRLREVRALARGEGELALEGSGAGTHAAGLAASVQKRINDTLADFRDETTEGRSLLEGVYRSTGKTAPLRVLTSFATQQKSRLSAIIPELPAGSATAAEQSLALVTEVGSTAGELLAIGTCGESCNPDAGGPTLPVEPLPTPGTSASPEQPEDNNGVPGCECVEPTTSPEPTAEPTESASPEPTPTEGPTPTPTPTPSPTSTGILPEPLPSVLPTDLPTILPTSLPSLLPPLPLPTQLPTLLPAVPDLGVKP
jgi:hypothetical protein